MNRSALARDIAIKERPTFIVSRAGCDVSSCQKLNHAGLDCFYRVAWRINPHMRPGVSEPGRAQEQLDQLDESLRAGGASVLSVPFVHGSFDSVFVKDNALLVERDNRREAFLGRPRFAVRDEEQPARRHAYTRLQFDRVEQSHTIFEGGDVALGLGHTLLGYGLRSSASSQGELEQFLGRPVTALRMIDPYLYHLDMALAMLSDGTILACREAFARESWRALERLPGVRALIPVSRDEALRFSLNLIEVNDRVIVGNATPSVLRAIDDLGKTPVVVDLSEFQRAGGSAGCLTSRIHVLNPRPRPTLTVANDVGPT